MKRNTSQWHEIYQSRDIQLFMEQMNSFHDSCLTELDYVSGSYVLPDLSMCALNDLRKLRIVIQRQYAVATTVELEFGGLVELRLKPADPAQLTSELFEIGMYQSGDCVIFSDSDLSGSGREYGSLFICAKSVRWRIVEGYQSP